MKKGKCFLGIILLALWGIPAQPKVFAKVVVNDYQELKYELEREGTSKIELGQNICITDSITIRGNKTLDGRGHYLERSKKKGLVYGGTLFLMLGKYCEWKNIVISGASDSTYVNGCIFGRLLEVRKGTVVLGKQNVWKNNKNEKLAVDGGGAIWIRNGATCKVTGAAITNNKNVSCGAGIRVDAGGKLVINHGKIVGNTVMGIGKNAGFEGLGGAIYNEGTIHINNGEISGNRAYSYQDAYAEYGGAGAGIYNKGYCCISNGVLENNKASQKGHGVYVDNGAVMKIKGAAHIDSVFLEKKGRLSGPKKVFLEKEKYTKEVKSSRKKEERKANVVDGKTREENKKEKQREAEKDEKKAKTIKKTKSSKEAANNTKPAKSDTVQREFQETIHVEKEKAKEHVHFVSSPCGSSIMEEWHFSQQEIKDIQLFMDKQKDPFSQETNQAFLQKYNKCRRGVVSNE